MGLFDRVIFGAAATGVPTALVSAFVVPLGDFLLILATPIIGALLGAALALFDFPPFVWLESKLISK